MAHEDSNLFLTLLTVQLHGGENVSKTLPALKGLSAPLKEAMTQGLIEEVKQKVKADGVTKSGKPKMKTVATYRLTETGRQRLKSYSDPAVQVAQQRGVLSAMQKELQTAHESLRQEVQNLLSPSTAGAEKSTKDAKLDQIVRALRDLASRVEKLESKPPELERVYDKLDAAFTAMSQKISDCLSSLEAPKANVSTAQSEPPPTPPPTLESVLADAYRQLCRRLEFEDGIVDIPRLFHQARREMPDLTVPQIHQELTRLWDSRILEVHVANEIHKVSEAEMGIWRDERFYYYVYWPALLN